MLSRHLVSGFCGNAACNVIAGTEVCDRIASGMESDGETSVSSDESIDSSLSRSDESFEQAVELSESTVEPYQYEPPGPIHSASSNGSSDGDDGDPGNERLGNTDW